MIIVGLTGSIATGKSFVAKCFAKLGIRVFDADACVHELLGGGGNAVGAVVLNFPEACVDGVVDRKKLGEIVFADEDARTKLEDIIHPLVASRREEFFNKNKEQDVVVLEIPLLFETGMEKKCDCVIVTDVDPKIQKERALQREGMTLQRFEKINSLQRSRAEKIKRAEFVIDTGLSEFSVFRRVKDIIGQLCGK